MGSRSGRLGSQHLILRTLEKAGGSIHGKKRGAALRKFVQNGVNYRSFSSTVNALIDKRLVEAEKSNKNYYILGLRLTDAGWAYLKNLDVQEQPKAEVKTEVPHVEPGAGKLSVAATPDAGKVAEQLLMKAAEAVIANNRLTERIHYLEETIAKLEHERSQSSHSKVHELYEQALKEIPWNS